MKKMEFGSYEEFKEYAEANGIELTDIDLQGVKGGTGETDSEENGGPKCPKCGSRNTYVVGYFPLAGVVYYKCGDCGHVWGVLF